MNVNMNSLRVALSEDLNKLGKMLAEAQKNNESVCEDITDAFDEAAQNANFLNCIFDNEDESFSDLSKTHKVNYLTEDQID